MKALVAMRKGSAALRSAERMTDAKWLVQGATRFGFVRKEGTNTVVALFNNSSSPSGAFTAPLPSGDTGCATYNYLIKNADGSYGANDPDVSWPDASRLSVSGMDPWEVKIIRIAS